MALSDRKKVYGTATVDNNVEKDYLDTAFTKYTFTTTSTFRVPEFCVGRLDLISYIHYNTSDYWWLIAQANDIMDPFIDLEVGMVIRIPSLPRYFSFYDANKKV